MFINISNLNINYMIKPIIMIIDEDVKLQIHIDLSRVFFLVMVVLKMIHLNIPLLRLFLCNMENLFHRRPMINRSLWNYKSSRYTTFQNLFVNYDSWHFNVFLIYRRKIWQSIPLEIVTSGNTIFDKQKASNIRLL